MFTWIRLVSGAVKSHSRAVSTYNLHTILTLNIWTPHTCPKSNTTFVLKFELSVLLPVDVSKTLLD